MDKKKFNFSKLLILIFVDLISISLSFLGAYYLKFKINFPNLTLVIPAYHIYWKVFLYNSCLWLLIFNLFGLYQLEKIENLANLSRIVAGIILGAVVSLIATFIYPEFSYARILIFYAGIFSIIILWPARLIIKNLIFKKEL